MARILPMLCCAILLPAFGWAAEYRMSDYRSPTPQALEGAVTIDTAQAKALLESGAAVAIDVMPAQRQPCSGTWLLPKPRLHLPGSAWLANVGYGDLSSAMQDWFRTRLNDMNGRGLIFYCMADCWMSWNAAKRAVEWGFAPVYWYRDGTDGWSLAGLPLEPATPLGLEN